MKSQQNAIPHITDVNSSSKAVQQLWAKDSKSRSEIETIKKLVDTNVPMSRLLDLLSVLTPKAHTSTMPDYSGENADHDKRYITRDEIGDIIVNKLTELGLLP